MTPQLRTLPGLLLLALLVGAGPSALRAQVAWDAPLLVGPGLAPGLSLHLLETSPGGELGGMAGWRAEGSRLGYRGGISRGAGGDAAVFGGVDFSGTLIEQTDEFPVEIRWVTGAGFGAGSDFLLSLPLGVSVGRVLEAGEGLSFAPWAAPRLFLDARLGDEGGAEGLDLGFAFDLGADLGLTDALRLRFGASVGDRSALAIGVVLPGL